MIRDLFVKQMIRRTNKKGKKAAEKYGIDYEPIDPKNPKPEWQEYLKKSEPVTHITQEEYNELPDEIKTDFESFDIEIIKPEEATTASNENPEEAATTSNENKDEEKNSDKEDEKDHSFVELVKTTKLKNGSDESINEFFNTFINNQSQFKVNENIEKHSKLLNVLNLSREEKDGIVVCYVSVTVPCTNIIGAQTVLKTIGFSSSDLSSMFIRNKKEKKGISTIKCKYGNKTIVVTYAARNAESANVTVIFPQEEI